MNVPKNKIRVKEGILLDWQNCRLPFCSQLFTCFPTKPQTHQGRWKSTLFCTLRGIDRARDNNRPCGAMLSSILHDDDVDNAFNLLVHDPFYQFLHRLLSYTRPSVTECRIHVHHTLVSAVTTFDITALPMDWEIRAALVRGRLTACTLAIHVLSTCSDILDFSNLEILLAFSTCLFPICQHSKLTRRKVATITVSWPARVL